MGDNKTSHGNPKFPEFDSSAELWSAYKDRMHFYFMANKISEDKDKLPLFLSSVSPAIFSLLQNLLAPAKITDATTTFANVTKLLDKHFDESANILSATYEFYQTSQKQGQSVSDWIANLRSKARLCGFQTSTLANKPVDRALRDMLVLGTNDSKARSELLKAGDPTLEEAEKIIRTADQLRQNINKFDKPGSSSGVAKIDYDRYDKGKGRNHKRKNDSKKPPGNKCKICGYSNHKTEECDFRDATCYVCEQKGHIATNCPVKKKERGKKRRRGDSKSKQQVKAIGNIGHNDNNKISLFIGDYKMEFELDTGTEHTLISDWDWQAAGCPPFNRSGEKLFAYGGTPIRVIGELRLQVMFDNREATIPVLLIKGNGSPLLGRTAIRMLQIDLNKFFYNDNAVKLGSPMVHAIYDSGFVEKLKFRYAKVFSPGLGECKGAKANIPLRPGVEPKFLKARPLPYAIADRVKAELDRNIQLGILERVDFSQWATPIVPIIKPTGAIRICGDYKVTINKGMNIPQYPIPSVDELMDKLAGGEKFSKIDLSDAYLQVPLDEPSREMCTINTPFGLYRPTRLPFGTANAPAVFQSIIDETLQGIPMTWAYLDDILVTGRNENEHQVNLEMVFKRLEARDLRIKAGKCEFFKDKICYLGHIISKDGKEPDPDRLAAIAKMPAPSNLKELESFLGKINYYGKFIPQFSEMAEPLNRLRRKGEKFIFDGDCVRAFLGLKKLLVSPQVLAHYTPNLPVILATDASDVGLGAVLSQKFAEGERPIAFASATLKPAERNYSQIEKEGLAIIFGLKKFYHYLAGRRFELITDHQPLVTIFHPNKSLPAYSLNRLQRWATMIMGFNFDIRYKKSHDNANADCLSRLPLTNPTPTDEASAEISAIQAAAFESSPIQVKDILKETERDKTLSAVIKNISNDANWPKKLDDELAPYYKLRDQLSVNQGVLLRNSQVVIPRTLRDRILATLHTAHIGVVKMKQTAREICYWPGINNDIERYAQQCKICAPLAIKPQAKFESWPIPDQIWGRVHMDFAEFAGEKYLVVVDAKSKFPFVFHMPSTTATALIRVLDQMFDMTGFPETVVSDNGPPFISAELIKFYESVGIKAMTSAPYHPQSNGIAERLVRTFKEGMAKLRAEGKSNQDCLRIFIRQARWSTHTITGNIPAHEFFGREFRSPLSLIRPATKEPNNEYRQTEFAVGDPIWFQTWDSVSRNKQVLKRKYWCPGKVTELIGHMMYLVKSHAEGDFGSYRRHRNQLRRRHPKDDGKHGWYMSSDDDADMDIVNTDGWIKPWAHLLRNEPPQQPLFKSPQLPQQTPPREQGAELQQATPPAPPAIPETPRRSTRAHKPTLRYSPGNVGMIQSDPPQLSKFKKLKRAIIGGATRGLIKGGVTGAADGLLNWSKDLVGIKDGVRFKDLDTDQDILKAAALVGNIFSDEGLARYFPGGINMLVPNALPEPSTSKK